MRRVAVTGLGVVAANGIGVELFWKACVEGQSGVSPIVSFDATTSPTGIAGEIKAFDPMGYLPDSARKSLKVMGRAAQFGLAAAGMALEHSGLELDREPLERIGVAMGTGIIPLDLRELAPVLGQTMTPDRQFEEGCFPNEYGEGLFPLWLLKYLPNMLAAHISLVFQLQGANTTVTTACVAGTQAVGEGARMISRGEADVMLCGGADSRLDPLMLLAYTKLGALSRSERCPSEVSRPFDRFRDGFVLGEGAAVLVLEAWEHAIKRDACILAEVLGFGSSFDAFSVTKPDPSGAGGSRAIAAALKDARVDPREIDHINAHGTSTRLNDWMETASIKRTFGAYAYDVPLTSIKSMIGHSIGAAGAIEAVALTQTLREGVIPPTINLHHPDAECDLDYTPNTAREQRVQTAISTSFGFGGQNGALVMRAV